MGTSHFQNIPYIVAIFKQINPKTMLDIGIGFGRYGFLAREALEARTISDATVLQWELTIDGIEIYEKYLMPHHYNIYSKIHIGDAFDIISDSDFHYDMMYAGDVLEHFEKNRAKDFIHKCMDKTDTLFINTPYVYFPQDELGENKNENHLSGWDFDDFKSLGAKYCFKLDSQTFAIFTDLELPLPKASEQLDKYSEEEIWYFKLMLDKYLKSNQLDACYRDCIKRIDIFENDYDVNMILAYVCDKMNIRDEARRFAGKALNLNPASDICKNIFIKHKV